MIPFSCFIILQGRAYDAEMPRARAQWKPICEILHLYNVIFTLHTVSLRWDGTSYSREVMLALSSSFQHGSGEV